MVETRLSDLRSAQGRALEFLLSRHDEDGAFRDYPALPVGAATAWTTAYVLDVLAVHGGEPAAMTVRAAARWLLRSQEPGGSWGYNHRTGADADSTAWSLLALRHAGLPAPDAARAWLRGMQNPDGGIRTYRRGDGWGCSHADVTPVALLALDGDAPVDTLERGLGYVERTMAPDATWPAYWWRGRHYGTYWNRLLLERFSRPVVRSSPSPAEASRAIASSFDLAWALALAVLEGDPPPALEALAGMLVGQQRQDGGWPPGADLRVTAPACTPASRVLLGAFYVDEASLITTGAAYRSLSQVLDRLGPGQTL